MERFFAWPEVVGTKEENHPRSESSRFAAGGFQEMNLLALQKEQVRPMAKKKNFIAGAIKHPGSLRAAAAKAGQSTRQYADAHKHDSGKTGQRSRLAITLMGMHK